MKPPIFSCALLIASPAAIRERLATLANGGDADGAHGDGRAGEMTDRE
jgi:hypothetical protein